ncbi:MAG: hypothetical protein ISP83_00860 [Candidatus Poseidonia sp.]|nr:hypothetical protein [Poseidonia sp.]MBL6887201.1 hypothetical protein [Poseidonia sp.]MBL6892060.1 hypothetical protein [Poseidonia sp.]
MGLRKGKKSKGKEPTLPMPNLPMPPGAPAPLPMPPGAAPLPPLPAGQLPPAPLPVPEPLPVQPASAPLPIPEPVNDSATTLSSIAEEKGYNDLWAKRSEKPLQQIYGHIDRISNKEAGSLLDRYADRFGHALDREIIVMRKAAMEEKIADIRDAPMVELLDEDVVDDTMSELEQVEHELRSLKPLYQEAKSLGDKEAIAELKPTLQALMARRKALKQGADSSEAPTAPITAESSDNDDDMFISFVSIVDDLLGEHLPESIVNAFVASDDFEIYRQVIESPGTTDNDTRSFFYNMVDDQLGNMSEDSINAFVSSSNFDIYRQIGEQYKDA